MGSNIEDSQILSFQDIKTHNKKSDCWLIISSKVYDATPFLDDHPGGHEILLKSTGRDATDDFNGVNHSDEATEILKKYYIGDLDSSTLPQKNQFNLLSVVRKQTSAPNSLGIFQVVLPLLIIVLAYGIYPIYNKS